MVRRSGDLRPIIYLLLLGSIWGLDFSLLKIAVHSGISYIGIATLTTFGACIGLLAITLVRGKPPPISIRHVGFYGCCAVLGYLVPLLVDLVVIGHMPASVLTLISSLSPIATLVIAYLMKTDSAGPRRVLGIMVGSIAVFLVLLPDANQSGGVAWRWLLLATLVPLSYALYHNYISRYWPEDCDTFQVAAGEAVAATIVLMVMSGFTWQGSDFAAWNEGHTAIAIMVVTTLIDIYIYFDLVRLRGPIYVSHANYFMVVSGVLWGMLIFTERPGAGLWFSVVLLLVSLYLISERRTAEEAVKAGT